MRSLRQRLVALLIGFALALLMVPGELAARRGPSTVEAQGAPQLALHSPKRASLGIGRPHAAIDDDGANGAHAFGGSPPHRDRDVVGPGEHVALDVRTSSLAARELRVRRLRTRGPPVV